MVSTLLTHPGVLIGALIFAVGLLLFLIGRIQRVLPRGGRLERGALRWATSAQALIVLLGSLGVVHLVYRGDPFAWRLLTVAILGAALWALRQTLSDCVSGLVLRAEGTLQVGERIGTGAMRGRIVGLGLRSAQIEAETGGLLRIPYSTLSNSALETSSAEAVTRSVTFAIDVSGHDDPEGLIPEVSHRALLSPWSSAQRLPSVRVVEGANDQVHLEVTVFPVDLADAPKIASAIRSAL